MRSARFLVPFSLWCLLLIGDRTSIPSAFAQPADCPEVFPVDEVEVGMQAQAWTVAQGTVPEPFRVEVLGVLHDGIALGRDMIIVEISDEPGGTMIERARGIWAGMSGSPVYVGDRLLGAIGWSFGVGPSPVGGVTPAEDMLEVLSIGDEPGVSTTKQSIAVPQSLRPLLAERAGVPESEVTTLESLPLPFGVSGLDSRGRDFLKDRLETEGISAVIAPTSSMAPPHGEITVRPVAGGNFAGMLAFGDVTIGGVGTTTYVCGDRALAFGHSLRLSGATSLSANDAETITVTTDPTARPFKLTNFGPTFGTLDQDRTVAIAATLGKTPPLVRIRAIVKAPDIDRSRIGVSWTPAFGLVPDVAAVHLLANLEAVFDEVGDGTSRVEWRVKGKRADGQDWFLRRSNRYASRSDVSFGSIGELFNQLETIEKNRVEKVTFRRVKIKAKVRSGFEAYHIESFTITKNGRAVIGDNAVEVFPGDDLVVRVIMTADVGVSFATDLAVHVPNGAAGKTDIVVFGGNAGSIPSREPDDEDPFQQILDELANEPKNNRLTAAVDDDSAAEDEQSPTSRRFGRVVEGFLRTSLDVKAPPTTSSTTTTTVTE